MNHRSFLLVIVYWLPWSAVTIKAEDAMSSRSFQDQSFIQHHSLHGTIIGEDELPLAGVNISVKGSSSGATTNSAGRYQLETPEQYDTLVISFVGYKTKEIPTNGATKIDISLEPEVKLIKEVVVVGYGERSKITLTGSVATLTGNELQRNPSPNISHSLAGAVPGVIANTRTGEPGEDDAEIFIRGKSTLGDNSPLIIIDGIPNRGGFSRLSAYDIESISILKDAAAAIYGARSANGVILVTSRRGKLHKPRIKYTGNYGLSGVTRYPELTNSYQYAVYLNEINNRYGRLPIFSDEEIKLYKSGADPVNYPNTDWYDVVIKKTTPQTQHNLSITGGNDDIQYYFSGDYIFQDGIYRYNGVDYKQYQIRSNMNAVVRKNLKFSFDLSLRQENRHSTFATQAWTWWSIIKSFPYRPAFYPNGLPAVSNFGNMALNTSSRGGFNDGVNRIINSKFSFDLNLSKILNGLSLSGYGAFDFNVSNTKQFGNNYDVYSYNAITQEYIPEKGGTIPRALEQSITHYYAATTFVRLVYDRVFLRYHHLGGFIAHEINTTNGELLTARRQDYANDELIILDAGGYNLRDNSGSQIKTARLNYIGQITYDFDKKYLIDFVLRQDGSHNFSEAKRFGWFYGASIAWRISEEVFMSPSKGWITNLKLRGSWSRLGNDRIPPYQFVTRYKFDEGYFLGYNAQPFQGLSVAGVANPNITWETSNQLNIGLDASMLKNELSLEFDYFHSRRDKILIKKNASVPDYTGLTLPDENIGQVNKEGIEILLHYTKKRKAIEFYVGGNFTFVKNRIKFQDESPHIPAYQRTTGYPMDSWLLYQTDGLYQSQSEINNTAHLFGTLPGDIRYVDVDKDGAITDSDRVRVFRSPTPEVMLGIKTGVSYKGLELNILLQGQARASQIFLPWGLNMPTEFFNERWTEGDSGARYPRAFDQQDFFNSKPSDFWLRDVSFIRLKNIEIGYTLSPKLTSKLRAHEIRIYITGSNLFTIDRAGIYDPESVAEIGTYYPQQRILSAGISLTY